MTTILTTYNNLCITGNLDIRALEVRYEGTFNVTNRDSSLLIAHKNNTVVILNMTVNSMPENVFSFNGNMKIVEAKAYTNNSYTHCNIEVDKILFGDREVKWGDDSQYFSNSNTTLGNKNDINDASMSNRISKNTRIESVLPRNLLRGDFVLRDGTSYKGDVIYHSNHRFFTTDYKELKPVRKKLKVKFNKKRKR